MRDVAALFVAPDSVYKGLPGVDAWDAQRDARRWPGGMPAVAHPPCALWARLRRFARCDTEERALGPLAVAYVRAWGGVVEHPAESSLWPYCRIPRPGEFADDVGGWTLAVDQFHFGHKAAKPTWLYIAGCTVADIPPVPWRPGRPTHVVKPGRNDWNPRYLRKAERHETPPEFAAWLVALARRCRA